MQKRKWFCRRSTGTSRDVKDYRGASALWGSTRLWENCMKPFWVWYPLFASTTSARFCILPHWEQGFWHMNLWGPRHIQAASVSSKGKLQSFWQIFGADVLALPVVMVVKCSWYFCIIWKRPDALTVKRILLALRNNHEVFPLQSRYCSVALWLKGKTVKGYIPLHQTLSRELEWKLGTFSGTKTSSPIWNNFFSTFFPFGIFYLTLAWHKSRILSIAI